MIDHPIYVASFRSIEPQRYRFRGVNASLTTMRLPCCDGGFVAGRFGGGRDAEKLSRRGVALLCGENREGAVFSFFGKAPHFSLRTDTT